MPVLWVILLAAAVGIVVFIERYLHYHRAQINSTEFLHGVRTVLKRDNVVEALSICDATPGPVARLVKTAILNRDQGRERRRLAGELGEALEEARQRAEHEVQHGGAPAPLAQVLGAPRGVSVNLAEVCVPRAERL